MSTLTLNAVGTPNTPASGKTVMFTDVNDGNRLKTKDSSGTVSTIQANGFDDKNILINGAYDVNQRAADANTAVPGPSATARVYFTDRWTITTRNTTTPQFQRVDTIAAPETGITARYYAKLTQITNAAKHIYAQVVPGDTVSQLRGRTVRLQIKAKFTAGSNRTMRLWLLQLNSSGTSDTLPATFATFSASAGVDATWGTNIAAITPSLADNGTIVGSGMNFTLTNVWQRFSALFAVPSNCVNLIAAVGHDADGAAADTTCLTEIGLYDGQEIRDWLPFPPEITLERAQHFFCKSFPQSTAPAQNAGSNGVCIGIVGIAGATALADTIGVRFPQTMHKTPTITLFSPGAASGQVRRLDGTATEQTASAASLTTDAGMIVTATGDAGGTVGMKVGVHYSADADI